MGVPNRRRMRRRAAGCAAGAAIAAAAWLAPAATAGPTHAVAHQSVTTVPDASEGWYASAPINTCALPPGCLPALPISPYPAGTLHVGAALGSETYRTYVQPDLSRLPPGAVATHGTMTLPVSNSLLDGTLNAAGARLLACLATQPFTPGAVASTQRQPAVDCLISTPPRYDAKKSELSIDLTPFLTAWAHGRADDGIAVVPSPSELGQSDIWQLSIAGRGAKSGPRVRSTLTYTIRRSVGPSATAPPPPVAIVTRPTGQLPPVATVPAVPPAPAPQVASPSQPMVETAAPLIARRGFQYPLAFLLPLALLAGGMYFARLFTRPSR